MKKIVLLCILLPVLSHVFGSNHDPVRTKATILPELIRPQAILLDDHQIYIIDEYRIFIYSKDDFQLLKIFGRVGDKPHQFKPYRGKEVRLHLDVQSDDLLIGSHERVSVFSKHGEFRRILKTHPQINYLCSMGENYVGAAYEIHAGTGKSKEHVLILDENLNIIKEVTESHLGGGAAKGFGGPDRKIHYDLVPLYFGFQVYDNKIFVGNAYRGFCIEIFDQAGKKHDEINKNYEQLKVTEQYRQERINKIQEASAYKRYKDFVAIDEGEYFPAFSRFIVSDGKIYVYTYKQKDGEQEIMIIDFEGNELERLFVPDSDYSSIRDGKYYYLSQNDDKEWELQVKELD